MSESPIVEFSSVSWLSRIKDSFKSVLVGVVLFIISFPLLFWNEGNAVRTAKSLEEGAGMVISVPAENVAPANEGKLVHLHGTTVTQGALTDDVFGVSMPALHLYRDVKMYQWVEHKKEEKEKKLGARRRKRPRGRTRRSGQTGCMIPVTSRSPRTMQTPPPSR